MSSTEEVKILETIGLTEFLEQTPKSKALHILPYLDHIILLRKRGYIYGQICSLFGMKESTFRYNLKKATRISKENPDLSTDQKIPDQSIDDSEKEPTLDHKETCKFDTQVDSYKTNSIEDKTNEDVKKGEQNNDQQSIEEWAAEIERTAKPSKYAHKFNLNLKHK